MNDAVEKANSESALVLDTKEKQLDSEVSFVEQKAMSVSVTCDSEYEEASRITKEVKATQKKVTEYWEPMRVSTKAAYDKVLEHKKEMLKPLENAEKILKGKISAYVLEVEKKQREAEEEKRRLAQIEAEKKLKEAEEAYNQGDEEAAEYAMTEAEIMEEVATSKTDVVCRKHNVDGVSTSRTWKITKIDEEKVPVDINGAVIRPVDESAIMALIKATKGKIKIPGITFEESVTVSVRTK